MTKKDYEKFAKMFRTLEAGPYTCPDVLEVCYKTADIFGEDNPRFDKGRYLKACGVRPEDGAAK
jgi:hypothetical protein